MGDYIGIIIFILVLVFKAVGKLGQEAGSDGAPQRPRRMPQWFPDFDEPLPPVISAPEEKRRTVPVNRLPDGTTADNAFPAEHVVAGTVNEAEMAAPEREPAPAAAPASRQPKKQPALIEEPAAENIIKGFVWAEILNPPRAKRPFAADSLRR